MTVVLAAPSAAAPPWASTAALTRSTPDCAAAGCASAAPNRSAKPGTRIRNMIFLPILIAKHAGLRRPLYRSDGYRRPAGPAASNRHLSAELVSTIALGRHVRKPAVA